MKYIAAFLNSDGGVLYVGVDDNSMAYGLELKQKEFDMFLVNIDGESKNNMLPPLMPHKYTVRRIPVINHRKGKELWIIEIKVTPTEKERRNKMLQVYNKEAYVRLNASTHRLDAISLMEYMKHNEERRQDQLSGSEMLEEVFKGLESRSKIMTILEWQ